MNFDIRIIGRRQEGGLHSIYHQTDKGYESFAQAVERFAKKKPAEAGGRDLANQNCQNQQG